MAISSSLVVHIHIHIQSIKNGGNEAVVLQLAHAEHWSEFGARYGCRNVQAAVAIAANRSAAAWGDANHGHTVGTTYFSP